MSNTTIDDALNPAEAEAFRAEVREFLEKNASGIGRRSETSIQIGKTYQAALADAGLAGLYCDHRNDCPCRWIGGAAQVQLGP